MSKNWVGRFLVTLWLLVMFGASLAAQSPLGTILGTVRDPSGALVPSAQVTITNLDTNFKRSAPTNDVGDFELTAVDPGPYAVEVEARGFKKYVQPNVQLIQRQVLRLDVTLAVGTTAETVTVSAQPSPVNSETASISEAYSRVQMDNYYQPLPMFRYTTELMGNYSLQSVGIGSAQYKVDGARTDQFRATQDGRVAYNYFGTPATETAEMKLVTVNANAEYAEPANFSLSSKSGTNAFHADAEFVVSNNALNALGPNKVTRPAGVGSYNSSYVGSGPVIIPKIYDGRNRTFFTVTYERSQSKDYQWTPLLNVPTAAMRNGDFSQYKDSSGNLIPILDPLTGQQFQYGGALNVIDPSRITQVSKNIQALYPMPNRGAATSILQNYTTLGHQYYAYNNFFVRADQKISNKDTFNFTYKLNHQSAQFDVGASGFAKVVGLWYAVQKQTVPGYSFAETHVFGPHMVNEARFAYDQYYQPSGENVQGQAILKQLGITGIDPSLNFSGAPNIQPSGYAGLGQVYNENVFTENRFTYLDNLTIQKSSHTIKTGFNYSRVPTTITGTSGNVFGTYSFTGRMTQGSLAVGGNSWADLLLGYPSTTTTFTPRPTEQPFNYLYGAFIQDDWKVTPRLTLNLGLRYDLEGSPVDRAGLFYSFDPKNGAIVFPSNTAMSAVSPLFNKSIPLELASAAGYPANLIPVTKHDFVPRIGLAYRPFNNATTVLRAAYGIYTTGKLGVFQNGAAQTDLNLGGPFALTQTFTSTQPGGGTVGQPTLSFPSPFLSVGTAAASYSVSFVTPNYRPPYMQQWNLSVEREFLHTAFRLSYVGDKSTNLTWTRNINQVPASTTPYNISGCSTAGARPSPTCRYMYFGFTSVNMIDGGGNDSYNSMHLEFTHPMSQSFQLHGGWIWASDITDVEESTAYAGPVGIDPYNRHYNRGLANNIPRNRFETDWTWQIPVGRGKRFLPGASPVVDRLLGSWVFSGYNNFMSETPYSVTYSGGVDPSGTGNFSGRADQTGNGNISSPTALRGFNTSAFAVPPCGPANASYPGVCMPIGRFGSSGRNIVYGPTTSFNYGRAMMFGLHKDVDLYQEKLRMRVSAYFNDPFNRWFYSAPDTTITNYTTVGQETRYGSRSIQLGAKLQF